MSDGHPHGLIKAQTSNGDTITFKFPKAWLVSGFALILLFSGGGTAAGNYVLDRYAPPPQDPQQTAIMAQFQKLADSVQKLELEIAKLPQLPPPVHWQIRVERTEEGVQKLSDKIDAITEKLHEMQLQAARGATP